MTSVFKKTQLEQLAADQKAKNSKKTEKVKLKSIVELIDEDRGDLSLGEYSKLIGYPYKNLWAVMKGNRTMPLEQTLAVCKRMKIPAEKSVQIYLSQQSKPHPAKEEDPKEKKRSLLDRTPLIREY